MKLEMQIRKYFCKMNPIKKNVFKGALSFKRASKNLLYFLSEYFRVQKVLKVIKVLVAQLVRR